ncbi:MAG: hypothetical protein ABI586_10725 [Candidatus Nanopelagicales bacterium]
MELIYADWYKLAENEGERLRVVVDQVAALTDPAAVALHHVLLNGGRSRGIGNG